MGRDETGRRNHFDIRVLQELALERLQVVFDPSARRQEDQVVFVISEVFVLNIMHLFEHDAHCDDQGNGNSKLCDDKHGSEQRFV